MSMESVGALLKSPYKKKRTKQYDVSKVSPGVKNAIARRMQATGQQSLLSAQKSKPESKQRITFPSSLVNRADKAAAESKAKFAPVGPLAQKTVQNPRSPFAGAAMQRRIGQGKKQPKLKRKFF